MGTMKQQAKRPDRRASLACLLLAAACMQQRSAEQPRGPVPLLRPCPVDAFRQFRCGVPAYGEGCPPRPTALQVVQRGPWEPAPEAETPDPGLTRADDWMNHIAAFDEEGTRAWAREYAALPEFAGVAWCCYGRAPAAAIGPL